MTADDAGTAATSPGAGDRQPGRPVALVTGGSSGIGLACARMLAEAGYDLMLAARNLEKLAAAQRKLLEEHSIRVETCSADLSEMVDAARVVRETIERYGRLDVLINNAGMAEVVPIPESDDAFIRKNYELNVFGPMCAIREVWEHWLERGAGCVVNVSSWAAMDPFPGFFVYASTKAALNSVTRSCEVDGEEAGVRAFSVCPGAVETPMLRASFDEATLGPEMCLSPEDVAAVVVACVRGEREGDLGRAIYLRRAEDGSVEVSVGD